MFHKICGEHYQVSFHQEQESNDDAIEARNSFWKEAEEAHMLGHKVLEEVLIAFEVVELVHEG